MGGLDGFRERILIPLALYLLFAYMNIRQDLGCLNQQILGAPFFLYPVIILVFFEVGLEIGIRRLHALLETVFFQQDIVHYDCLMCPGKFIPDFLLADFK